MDVTDVNNETEKSPAKGGGLPLRGLAMVLIAVAVLLGLWGLYSLTQGGNGSDSTEMAAESTESSASAPAQSPAPEAGSEQTPADDATEDDAARESAAPDTSAEGDAAAEGAERDKERDGERDRAADAAPGGAASPAEPARLNVLNNSTVPELAAEVSEKLGDEGYELGEVGNFADEIFPETTVFFTPGNPEAEAEARELASRLKGVARENADSLPDNTTDGNDITLVLVKEVVL